MIISRIKNWLLLILAALLLISGSLAYFFLKRSQKFAQEAKRWENNYDAKVSENQKTAEQYRFTKKELEKQGEIIAVLKQENIKPKKVQFIYRTQFRDTGSIRIKVIYPDSSNKWNYPITSYFEEPGYKSYWTYYPTLDTSEHRWEKETKISLIGHWEREHEFRAFGKTLFHFGRKNNFVTVIDEFNDSEILKNQFIDIKKRK